MNGSQGCSGTRLARATITADGVETVAGYSPSAPAPSVGTDQLEAAVLQLQDQAGGSAQRPGIGDAALELAAEEPGERVDHVPGTAGDDHHIPVVGVLQRGGVECGSWREPADPVPCGRDKLDDQPALAGDVPGLGDRPKGGARGRRGREDPKRGVAPRRVWVTLAPREEGVQRRSDRRPPHGPVPAAPNCSGNQEAKQRKEV